MLKPLQDQLQRALGQPVVIEFKPSASGAIGTLDIERPARRPHAGLHLERADGLLPVLRPEVGYDTVTDFAPIGVVARAPAAVVANPNVPADLAGFQLCLASSLINNLVREKRLMAAASATPMFASVDLVSRAVPGMTAQVWYGMVAPKGTAPEIVQRVSRLVTQQLEDLGTRRAYDDTSCEPVGGTPDQMAELIRTERAYWHELARGVKTPS